VVSGESDLRTRHRDALEQTGWNISRASKILGISRLTLRARIRRWELTVPTAQRQQGKKGLPVTHGLGRPQILERSRDAPDRAKVGEDEQLGVYAAQPLARADSHEVRWERHWLGFLQLSLTGFDADDDAMVCARPYVHVALEKVQQFGGHLVEIWPTGLSAAF